MSGGFLGSSLVHVMLGSNVGKHSLLSVGCLGDPTFLYHTSSRAMQWPYIWQPELAKTAVIAGKNGS